MSGESELSAADITDLLQRWSRGERDAFDRVLPLVYAELRKIAARQLRHDHAEHSVDPTDLVHALYLQLVDQRRASWANRAQFYGVVAQMMRAFLSITLVRESRLNVGQAVSRCPSPHFPTLLQLGNTRV